MAAWSNSDGPPEHRSRMEALEDARCARRTRRTKESSRLTNRTLRLIPARGERVAARKIDSPTEGWRRPRRGRPARWRRCAGPAPAIPGARSPTTSPSSPSAVEVAAARKAASLPRCGSAGRRRCRSGSRPRAPPRRASLRLGARGGHRIVPQPPWAAPFIQRSCRPRRLRPFAPSPPARAPQRYLAGQASSSSRHQATGSLTRGSRTSTLLPATRKSSAAAARWTSQPRRSARRPRGE